MEEETEYIDEIEDEDIKTITQINEDLYIKNGEEEIKWNFLNKDDLKTAYWIGLYYNLVDNLQGYYLKTRGLQKQLRGLFERMDREKILKIFHYCNDVMFKIQSAKRLKGLSFKNVRNMIELNMKNDKWSSSSEEIAIAFMYGYDSSFRTYEKNKHRLVKKNEKDQE